MEAEKVPSAEEIGAEQVCGVEEVRLRKWGQARSQRHGYGGWEGMWCLGDRGWACVLCRGSEAEQVYTTEEMTPSNLEAE